MDFKLFSLNKGDRFLYKIKLRYSISQFSYLLNFNPLHMKGFSRQKRKKWIICFKFFQRKIVLRNCIQNQGFKFISSLYDN